MNFNVEQMYQSLGISKEVYDYCENIIEGLSDRFEQIDKVAETNP